jgi:hypothetical protein
MADTIGKGRKAFEKTWHCFLAFAIGKLNDLQFSVGLPQDLNKFPVALNQELRNARRLRMRVKKLWLMQKLIDSLHICVGGRPMTQLRRRWRSLEGSHPQLLQLAIRGERRTRVALHRKLHNLHHKWRRILSSSPRDGRRHQQQDRKGGPQAKAICSAAHVKILSYEDFKAANLSEAFAFGSAESLIANC